MFTGILLVLLSVSGFLISLYFTLVYYRRIPANYFLVPRICRMNESTCQTVLSTRDARALGVPNFLLGLPYYTLVCLAGLLVICGEHWEGIRLLFWLSALVVLLGVYLSYSLLFKIKISCPLCFASHVINAFITLFLYLQQISEKF